MHSVPVTRTYLHLTSPGQLQAAAPPGPEVRVERESESAVAVWRFLYNEVGRLYHWVDRRDWADAQAQAYFARPEVSLWTLHEGEALAGYFELCRHPDGSVEIAYFGLLDRFLGRGLGKYLLTEAVGRAWKLGATRVWLHTCTLDHPAALPNYLKRGFQPYRTETYAVEE